MHPYMPGLTKGLESKRATHVRKDIYVVIITASEITYALEREQGILRDTHLVGTNGDHLEGYANVREVAHDAKLLCRIGRELGDWFNELGVEVIVGPRTLGEKLAGYAALEINSGLALECEKVGTGKDARMEFSPKFPKSANLVRGKAVGIIDDLLRSGESFNLTSALIRKYGGKPIAAAAAVSRNPEVTAADCGVVHLWTIAEITGLGNAYSPNECAKKGMCKDRRPMRLRPGHGHEWIANHKDYPTA